MVDGDIAVDCVLEVVRGSCEVRGIFKEEKNRESDDEEESGL